MRGGPALMAGAIFAAGAVAGAMLATQAGLRSVRSSEPPMMAVPAATVGDGGQADVRSAHPAQVLRVIDGDTFEARVRVWPGLDITTKVRLRGIDAPELGARCAQEAEKAEAARTALAAILAEGAVGLAYVVPDKYGGRVVADASTRGRPTLRSRYSLRAWLAAMPAVGGRPGADIRLPGHDHRRADANSVEQVGDVAVVHADATVRNVAADRAGAIGAVDRVFAAREGEGRSAHRVAR
jgi:endonuclease YncB( thermonuclease family)